MFEANNPEINVDVLMQKIRQEVTQRKNDYQPVVLNSTKFKSSAVRFDVSHIETLLGDAESRANVRTKWPDKWNRFPFNFSSVIQKTALKILGFIFKDQREVNFNLIQSLKESLLLNQQLISEIANLRSQVEQSTIIIENSVPAINKRLDIVDDSLQTFKECLTKADGRQQAFEECLTKADGRQQTFEECLTKADVRQQAFEECLTKADGCQQSFEERLHVMEELLGTKVTQSLPPCLEVTEESYINTAIALSKIPIEEHYQHNKKDLFYYLFENVFYNSEVVKEKQKIYLKFINLHVSQSYRFFDAGCGRGEFLQNLTEKNIKCIGVDLNKLEVNNLIKSGFDAHEADILDYLESHNEQYSGVSAFQVVEHLNFEYIHKFLSISFERLVNDGVIIIETVNPHNLYGLSNFYQDPTHIKPIPPEMLKFILEWHGFKKVKIVYSSLFPKTTRIFRDEKMNYQDYAVLGYKKI
ncbi:class I SAM-dependent methyltransferase [Halotia branconii]|uniref:Class I SAM-dependent methyltransferase n=1 Tax=Halotia branconii CENA392 TaxID=1539056 RepID=A0AAJ6NRP0_9CYAN|nr:class I SAM-dependent methyltransferase [Halotia branconii]WGV25483.1 class I SAM-dependent methyltransferase [Halotia branconii CENA392]